jgi:hypothetical protein
MSSIPQELRVMKFHDAAPPPTPSVRSTNAAAYLVVGCVAVAVVGIAVTTLRSRSASTPARVTLHPADLHGMGEGFTELNDLEIAELGPLETFDPIAHVPWATTLARTWSPDVRLTGLLLHQVRENGTMDVSAASAAPDWAKSKVTYEFASKGRDVGAKAMIRVSDKPVWSAIDIVVQKGTLRAMVVGNSSDDRDPTPLSFTCKVPQMIELWRTKGLPFKQTYNIDFRDTLSGTPSWSSGDWGVPALGLDCRPVH